MAFLRTSNKLLAISNSNFYLIVFNRGIKWPKENTELFADLFDLTKQQCYTYKYENKLPLLSTDHLKDSAKLCQKLGIDKMDWLEFPTLLKQLALTVEQQYLYLQECGFVTITAEVLAKYRKCVHKKINLLKAHGLIPQHANVVKNFTSHLESDFQFTNQSDDNYILQDVHHIILTRYLMWKCEATQQEIEKFFRVYSLSRIKSFELLRQNFALADKLGFSPRMILKYGYLLTNWPEYSRTILNEMPVIAGMEMSTAMRKWPKLTCVPPRNFVKIYDHLKNAGIPDRAIRKFMNVFTLSPETVKIRLDEIESIPELNVLRNNSRILNIVVRHNEVRSRLSFLKQIQLKCATTSVLGKSSNDFNVYIRGGKDINSTNEIVMFLKGLLQTDDCSLIRANLKKHKYYRHVPLLQMQRTYHLLKGLQFTPMSVINVTQVLLYPEEKVSAAYKQMKASFKERYETCSLDQRLNLMLYLMEKEHHFTGNGIWTNSNKEV